MMRIGPIVGYTECSEATGDERRSIIRPVGGFRLPGGPEVSPPEFFGNVRSLQVIFGAIYQHKSIL